MAKTFYNPDESKTFYNPEKETNGEGGGVCSRERETVEPSMRGPPCNIGNKQRRPKRNNKAAGAVFVLNEKKSKVMLSKKGGGRTKTNWL